MDKYNFEFNFKQDSIISAVAKAITCNSTVLEFGPAHGRLTKHLKEVSNCTVDIVEIDEEAGQEAAAYARTALIGTENGDIDNFKWFDVLHNQKYDYVVFADVLEHLHFPEEVLKKVSSLIKDEGSILVSFPNIAHNSILINLYNNSFNYTDTGLLDNSHIKFWGLSNFRLMVERAGYVITDVRPFYLDPVHTEQSNYFADNYKELELLFSDRDHGNIYQYFIKLNKKEMGITEFNIDAINRKHELSIYSDLGNGFTEEKKRMFTISAEKETDIEFTITEDTNRIRIDPLEGQYCRVFLKVIDKDNIFYDFESTNSIGKSPTEFYEFVTRDPWFIISGPFKRGHTFIIKVMIKKFPAWEIAEQLEQVKAEMIAAKSEIDNIREESKRIIEDNNQKLSELKVQLSDSNIKIAQMKDEIIQKEYLVASSNQTILRMSETINEKELILQKLRDELVTKELELNKALEKLEKLNTLFISLKEANKAEVEQACVRLEMQNKDINDLKRELQLVYNAYNDILRSTCWKITKPLRIILDHTKSIKVINLIAKTVRYIRHFGFNATAKKIKSKIVRNKKANYKQLISLQLDYEANKNPVNTDKSVSIVIPTKNGGSEFELLILNLLNQKGFKKIEVVIVDSGSTDSTLEIARKYNAKIIEIKPEEFSHSYARNLGIENASSEYICVMTQDALPTSEYWLYNIYSAMISDKKIAAVSCAEYSRNDSDLYYRAFAWNHYKYLGALNSDVLMSLPESNDPILIRQNGQLSDITCFAKRETFVKYKYRGDFAEDLDFGLRLISDGYKLAFLGNEVSIHSHNRDAFYYLKRRFVELITLKSIFEDQEILNYRYSQVIKEMIFIYYYVSEILEQLQKSNKSLSFPEFRERFIALYHGVRSNCYPKVKSTDDLVNINCIDNKTLDFLNLSISYYNELITRSDITYDGVMIDATEGYLNVIFDYMSECYELVDSEILKDFSDCVYKILTSVSGTFFAYSYLSSEDDKRTYKEFYERIGEGV